MAKHKKKRNKQYSGEGAAIDKPVITRITASNRSPIGQWWFEHKKLVKTVAVVIAVALGVIILIVEIVRLIFHI